MEPQQERPESAFNRHFLPGFAVYLVSLAAVYIASITFLTIPKENQRFADTVLGFLLATVVGAVIKFYYDSTRSAQATQKAVTDLATSPTATVFPQAGSVTTVDAATNEEKP